MKKLVYLIIIILLLTGCSKDNNTNINISIGVLQNLDSIPIIIAKEKGFFEKEGINVTIEKFKSAVDRDSALQTNNIDGCASDMLSVMFLKKANFDVAITSKTEGVFKILSNSPVLNNGSTIGISKNTIIEYITDIFAKQNNIDIEKTEIPKMPTRLEMFSNRKLDMVTLPDPLATAAESDNTTILATSDSLGINPAIMLFNMTTLKSKDKKIIDKFNNAYNLAVDYINSTPVEEYEDLIIEKCDFPPDIKGKLTLPNYSHAVLPEKEQWDMVSNWMLEKELIYSTIEFDEVVFK